MVTLLSRMARIAAMKKVLSPSSDTWGGEVEWEIWITIIQSHQYNRDGLHKSVKESSVLSDVKPILFYQTEVSHICREILILKLDRIYDYKSGCHNVTSNLRVVGLRTNSYRNDRANQDKQNGRSDKFWEEQISWRVFHHFDKYLQNLTDYSKRADLIK